MKTGDDVIFNEFNQLKKLWQVSFGDDAQFVDLYFERVYRFENTVTRTVDDRIASAAQFLYFDITCRGNVFKGVYLLGICTHPEYRRRGLSSDIIRQILTEQSALGVDIAFLIPQEEHLFGFYENLGFTRAFAFYEGYVSPPDINVGRDHFYEIMTASMDNIYEFYNNFYRSLNSAIIKDLKYFLFTMDYIKADGRIDICGVNGEIRGFAATEGNVVKELLYIDKMARDTLLLKLFAEDNKLKNLKVITPVSDSRLPGAVKKTIGMMHVLNPGLSEPITAFLLDSYANLLLN